MPLLSIFTNVCRELQTPVCRNIRSVNINMGRYPFVICLLIFVAGCSSIATIPPVPEAQQAWQQRLQRLQDQASWSVQASVVGISDNEQFKARFRWQQDADRFEIKLFDPIGRVVAKITGSEQQVEVRTSKGEHYRDTDAQALIKQLFSLDLPVNGLRYWALGIPHPDHTQARVEVDARGLAAHILDSGWQIEYTDYALFNGEPLPKQFMLSYAPTELRVSVGTWQLQ